MLVFREGGTLNYICYYHYYLLKHVTLMMITGL